MVYCSDSSWTYDFQFFRFSKSIRGFQKRSSIILFILLLETFLFFVLILSLINYCSFWWLKDFFKTNLLEEFDNFSVLDPVALFFVREFIPISHENCIIYLQIFYYCQIIWIVLFELVYNVFVHRLLVLNIVYLQDLLIDLFFSFKNSISLEVIVALELLF